MIPTIRIQTLSLALALICTLAVQIARAEPVDHPPADHGGAQLVLGDGDRIWGLHTGLSRLEIPTSVTVIVLPYYPDVPGSGGLTVHAGQIVIGGVLDATGAGFTGGGGEGGAKGAWKTCEDCPYIEVQQAAPGAIGPARYGGSEPDGPWAALLPGGDGGYAAFETNGDDSTDTSVLMGSGARGGEGGPATPPSDIPWLQGSTGGGGGGGGGCGGGTVALFADSILIESGGAIFTRGAVGGNGFHGEPAVLADICPEYDLYRPCLAYNESFGGDGGAWQGDVDQPQQGLGGLNGSGRRAQSGGAGAGGGLLLYCAVPGGLRVAGTLDARGGRDQLSNGGTIKLFFRPPLRLDGSTIQTPRLFLRNLDAPPPTPPDAWRLSSLPIRC
ncbi:MAG: hypothetical protein Kow0059_01710 [Candidatus Sumerlaeia bacterium]